MSDCTDHRLPQRIPGTYRYPERPAVRPPEELLARIAAAVDKWATEADHNAKSTFPSITRFENATALQRHNADNLERHE